MSEALRILHVVPASPFGGAQRLAIDLAREQVRVGHNATLLVVARSSKDADHTVKMALEAGVPTRLSVGAFSSRLMQSRAALVDAKPDLVHLHVPPPWFSFTLPFPRRFALIAHLHVCPILTEHRGTLRNRISGAMDDALLSRCDRLIAISQWVAVRWRSQLPKCDPVVIYNGVRLPEGSRSRLEEPFTLGMASRLAHNKGVEEFLELAAQVHRQAPDIRFLIAGDGPLRSEYEAKAAALNLSGVLEFEGFVSDMSRFWAGLDVAAFTAPFEPFGLRLIEPIAHGVPVVAYRTNSGSDEVIDRCRGVRSVPYGEADNLAEQVLALRASVESRARMINEGYADIQLTFSIDVMARTVELAYSDALEERLL